jgi:hypothetical protein
MTLQLILSFGHVHLDKFASGPVVTTDGKAPNSSPAQHPSNDADDYCAICATLYLAANAFVPLAPQLAVPFVSRPVEHVDHVTTALILPRRAPFQSRAPPAA